MVVSLLALAEIGSWRAMENLMPLVLLYHDVTDGDDEVSGFPGSGAARYKLSRADFNAHLDAIAVAAKSPPALMSEAPPGTATPLVLTFDDGGLSAATLIADQLEQRGWKAHFFITADYIGRPGFVSHSQIRDLARRGHRIGSHSCSHPTRMSCCSRAELLEEWRRSREVLSSILGEPVTSASVPGGYYSWTVGETAAETGYTHLFNSEPTTRVSTVGNCHILGRYTIFRGMAAAKAAALATGYPAALWKQAMSWKLKKVVKSLGGPAYLGLRRALLDRRYARV